MSQTKEQKILRSATRVFLKEGFDKTSMRKIATAAGVSVGTLYLYFENKDQLFYAVQDVAFNHFLNYMKPLMDIADPAERLEKLGETYIFFALQNPGYYDLMFITTAPMKAVTAIEGWRKGQQLFELLRQTIHECIARKLTIVDDADMLSFLFWSTVHGMVSLSIKDRVVVLKSNETEGMMRRINRLAVKSVFR